MKKKTAKKIKSQPKKCEKLGVGSIDELERNWPEPLTDEVKAAFNAIRNSLKNCGKPQGSVKIVPGDANNGYFDPLAMLRRVLISNDLLFLSRQVTYHIAADADLPQVFADSDEVVSLFTQTIEHIVKRATRGSRISITLKGTSVRSGPAIELIFSNDDAHLKDTDKQSFLAELFHDKPDEVSGISIAHCRQMAVRQQGQLWVDYPKSGNPLYHLVLPSSEQASSKEKASGQTFKYDISISNYANVRKRFGIRKSQSLVDQIERYVKSLVRYPIDMVLSLSDKGIITAIYETQKGSAQSVASRISKRLGSEKFCIGKREVDLAFSYRLSPLLYIRNLEK